MSVRVHNMTVCVDTPPKNRLSGGQDLEIRSWLDAKNVSEPKKLI